MVDTTPFLDPKQFPWTALLEDHYPAIRAEAERVLHVRSALPNFQDAAPNQIRLSEDDQWKAYWFAGYGVWDNSNCIRCPNTAAVLRAIPGLTTALFSILGPGKHLRPHRGLYRGVLRHHLALIVPEPASASGIKVDGEERHWTEGESMVFDDTYVHEAWNDTAEDRVVLFLDILRPLRFPFDTLNRTIVRGVAASPLLKTSRREHYAREAEFAKRWESATSEGDEGT